MQLEVPSGVLCCGNIQILLWALVLLYHHIVSIALLSRNHLSWKGSLKVVWSSSPVRNGVSYNPIRLLRAWSSLKYQSLFHLRFKQSNYKNTTAYKLSHPSPQLSPERPQSVNNPCSPHLMNSCFWTCSGSCVLSGWCSCIPFPLPWVSCCRKAELRLSFNSKW